MARRFFWLPLLPALLMAGCVTAPASYQPPANPNARDLWHYRLDIDPPLPPDQVRVDVLFTASKPGCPVSQVGLRIDPRQSDKSLAFQVFMDQFKDPRCGWRANQIWVALGKNDGYRTRFSLPVGSAPQTRWCRLNPRHGVCMSSEREIQAYKVPGTVHKVQILRTGD